MRDIIFYLLLGLLLYYILSRFIENYSLEQENFDPSLVPVSSIVTLAKVAQKLVTGGVLTNPGSLQIGTPNAGGAGNLVVTGNTTVNGNTTLANVKINPVGTTGNTIIQYGDGTGKKVVFQKDDANPQLEIFDNKKVNVKGELNVEGIFKGNNTLVGTNPGNHGQTSIDGGKITIGDTDNYVEKLLTDTGTKLIIQGKDGGALETSTVNLLNWDNTGVSTGNLKVNGSLTTPSIQSSTAINTPSGLRESVRFSPTTNISGGNYLGINLCDPLDTTKCAKLTYDSAKGIIRFDKGLELNNALTTPGFNRKPGLYTNNIIFSPTTKVATDKTSQEGSLENEMAHSLSDYNWIPNGSFTIAGNRNDGSYSQLWAASKLNTNQNPNETGKTQVMYIEGNRFGGCCGTSSFL